MQGGREQGCPDSVMSTGPKLEVALLLDGRGAHLSLVEEGQGPWEWSARVQSP